MLNIYGIRKCLVCQKTFEAIRPAKVTCSEKCRIARRKALKKESHKRNNELLWENLEWLNCKLEDTLCNRKIEKKCLLKETPVTRTTDNNQEIKTEAKKTPCKKYRHVCTNCGSTFKSVYEEDSFCCEDCEKEASICGGIN